MFMIRALKRILQNARHISHSIKQIYTNRGISTEIDLFEIKGDERKNNLILLHYVFFTTL